MRLEHVSAPLGSAEARAADGLSQSPAVAVVTPVPEPAAGWTGGLDLTPESLPHPERQHGPFCRCFG